MNSRRHAVAARGDQTLNLLRVHGDRFFDEHVLALRQRAQRQRRAPDGGETRGSPPRSRGLQQISTFDITLWNAVLIGHLAALLFDQIGHGSDADQGRLGWRRPSGAGRSHRSQ